MGTFTEFQVLYCPFLTLSNIIYMSAAAELSSVQGSHIWCLETKLTTKQAKYFVENR